MYTALADEAEDAEKAAELRKMIDPEWSGVVVYRGLVPVDKVDPEVAAKYVVRTAIVRLFALV